ncbi:MAG: carboxylating nicotinate-nucleotide diphosphorylase [Balneolaceae bacterium]
MNLGNFYLDNKIIDRMIDQSLMEDIGTGDVTTNSIVDPNEKASAHWVTKQEGIICGLGIAKKVFQKMDEEFDWEAQISDGDWVDSGKIITRFSGNCRAILTAERVALNFAQRMSGISTETNKMVRLLEGLHTEILDTRKTIPGFRQLDKYAVSVGGGKNHRIGLFDMAMIKDNHITAAGSITIAVARVRDKNPEIQIEVETTSLNQVYEALDAEVELIMLDNMDIEMMAKAVKIIDGKALTEASGNLTGEHIRKVAMTGVDFISSGSLTHSVQAFDISQKLINIYK